MSSGRFENYFTVAVILLAVAAKLAGYIYPTIAPKLSAYALIGLVVLVLIASILQLLRHFNLIAKSSDDEKTTAADYFPPPSEPTAITEPLTSTQPPSHSSPAQQQPILEQTPRPRVGSVPRFRPAALWSEPPDGPAPFADFTLEGGAIPSKGSDEPSVVRWTIAKGGKK